jgi:cysteine-rich repeat protein
MSEIAARFNAGMDIWANAGHELSTYYDFLPTGFTVTSAPGVSYTGFSLTAAGSGIAPLPGNNAFSAPGINRFPSFAPALTVFEVFNGQTAVALGARNVFASTVVDHLECYKVKDNGRPVLKGIVNLSSEQFGLAEGCKIGKATKFCVPAKKLVIQSNVPVVPEVGQNLEDDRICYKINCPKVTIGVDAEDQFGRRKLSHFKPFELCTPARKSPPGQIAVFKINDLNGNGIRDPGEPGLPGWTVTISSAGPPPFTASGTTAGGGLASFYPVPLGDYSVTETPQAGWVATGPTTQTVTVNANSGIGVFFLNQKVAGGQIFVLKFKDLNGNGLKDAGEPGMPGWTITVTGPSGTVVGTTNAAGTVDFFGLPAGAYVISETLQPGWSATGPTSYPWNLAQNVGVGFKFSNRCECAAMTGAVCGDGVQAPCEECDDGNATNGDGCNECCALEPAVCGDGVVTLPEQCDPPGAFTCPGGAACSAACACPSLTPCDQTAPTCNGHCDPGQACTATKTCASNSAPCTIDANCPPGDTCETGCGCAACQQVCVGGSSAGNFCLVPADCPGGSCQIPPCCCFPGGAPACTNSCPGSGTCLCP